MAKGCEFCAKGQELESNGGNISFLIYKIENGGSLNIYEGKYRGDFLIDYCPKCGAKISEVEDEREVLPF